MTPTNQSNLLLLDAMHFAAQLHRTQRRKGTHPGDGAPSTPYINHPLAVAHLLAHHGGVTDPIVLAAAILHDVIEDTVATEEDVRARFGDAVCDIVLECSDDKSLPKATRKRLQVEHASHKSAAAKVVKLADKISNLHDLLHAPPTWPLLRVQEYFDWAHAVVAGLRGVNPTLEAEFDALYVRRPPTME